MNSSGMLRRVALVTTHVSEERIASIIRVERISELGKTLTLTCNRSTLRRNIVLCLCAACFGC
jgi:archaellum biogenesis ATPase FlaH